MNPQLLIAVLAGAAAAIQDIVCRRISNWISASAFVAGVAYLSTARGWPGLFSALSGGVGGFGVFLVLYWLGGMGGGDVKLMAALGAVVGVEHLLAAALWTAACGGLVAIICIAASALRRGPRVETIPYAPAIALGSWLALLPGL